MSGSFLLSLARAAAVLLALSLSLPAQDASVGAQTGSPNTPDLAAPAGGGQGQAEQSPAPAVKSGPAVSAQELANQVNNPAAPVTSIQIRNILLPDLPGTDGVANTLQIQPVLPITPFGRFPFMQLIKITMPIAVTLPGVPVPESCPTCGTSFPGATGVGDLQVFDLVTIKQSWGRWGFGPALSFPTASAKSLGSGKWEAGPAFALMYTGIRNLTAGAILQNPISYAGSPDRAAVSQLIITPTFTFNLKQGWFVGLGDFNWSFNWQDGGAATIPLGCQVGKVQKIGRQPFSIAFEGGGAVARPSGLGNPGWILGFEIIPIFSFHLGPHQKVRVRGK
jgi:hypothetical protein